MNNATVISHTVFADFSGAPAVIAVDGFKFSFDQIGKMVCHCLNQGGRSPSKRIVAIAEWRYALLMRELPAGWLDGNRALYTDTPHHVGSV